MYQYKYIPVDTGGGFLSGSREHRELIDKYADLAGMIAPLVALAQRKQLPVFRNTDRTDVRAGLDTKNKTHMIL